MSTKLYIHDRHDVVRELDSATTEALEAVYQEHAGRHQVAAASRVVQELADGRCWLACGCTSTVSNAPILFPRRNKHSVTLVHAPARPMHFQGCPFAREKVSIKTSSNEKGSVAYANEPICKPWNFGNRRGKEVALVRGDRDEEDEGAASQGRRMPRLGRILMTLLKEAGLDTIPPEAIERVGAGSEAHSHHYFRLVDSASYGRLTAVGHVKMRNGSEVGDVVCLSPAGLQGFKRAASRGLGQRSVVERFMLVMIDRVEGDFLIYQARGREAKLKLNGPVRMFGVEDGTRGPYWGLVRLKIHGGSSWAGAVETYLHPAVSRGIPVPVDSRLERHYLKRLVEQVVYWRDKHKDPLNVTLFKPLFDLMAGDQPCRPDVILVPRHGFRLIVEIMGRKNDPEYLASKQVTHPRMRGLGQIHDLIDVDEKTDWNDFRRVITGGIYAATRHQSHGSK